MVARPGVAGIAHPAVQRDDDDRSGGEETADPADAFAAAFDTEEIVEEMSGLGLGAGDLAPGAIPGDAPQEVQAILQRDPAPGAGPATRQASTGDLLAAIAAIPEVKSKLDQLKSLALNLLKAAMSTPAGATTVVSVAVGGAATLTAIDPTRKIEFNLLNGKKIPIPLPPLRDSLTITPLLSSDGKFSGGTLSIDLAKWIPGLQ